MECSNFLDLPNGYVHYRLRVTRHLSCPIYHHWHISAIGQVIFRGAVAYALCICIALESGHASPRIMTTSNRHRWIYVQLFLPYSYPRREIDNQLPTFATSTDNVSSVYVCSESHVVFTNTRILSFRNSTRLFASFILLLSSYTLEKLKFLIILKMVLVICCFLFAI